MNLHGKDWIFRKSKNFWIYKNASCCLRPPLATVVWRELHEHRYCDCSFENKASNDEEDVSQKGLLQLTRCGLWVQGHFPRLAQSLLVTTSLLSQFRTIMVLPRGAVRARPPWVCPFGFRHDWQKILHWLLETVHKEHESQKLEFGQSLQPACIGRRQCLQIFRRDHNIKLWYVASYVYRCCRKRALLTNLYASNCIHKLRVKSTQRLHKERVWLTLRRVQTRSDLKLERVKILNRCSRLNKIYDKVWDKWYKACLLVAASSCSHFGQTWQRLLQMLQAVSHMS